MKMLLGVLIVVASLMLLGCTMFEEATSDLEDKAEEQIQNETEVNETAKEGCEYKYWFDSSSTSCGFKQFCGMYMYQGLMTFDSLEECEEELDEMLKSEEEIVLMQKEIVR